MAGNGVVISRVIIGLGPMAKVLQVSIPTVYMYLREGMPGRKIGGQWHFHTVPVDKWFHNTCAEKVDPAIIDREEQEFGIKK